MPQGRLKGLEGHLNEHIQGQPHAMSLIAQAVQRAELGFTKPNRPKGSFLFLGPTGCGKTETINCLSTHLYGAPDRYARFDMAEFMDDEASKRLIGRNRDEQGLLGDRIDALVGQGGGIILFDEIEKAHPDINKLFLGMMDAARVTMANGVLKRLEGFYLVATSNLGSANAIRMENLPYATLRRQVIAEARGYFSPEVFARFTEAIVFRKLTQQVLAGICRSMLTRELAHLEKVLGVRLAVDGDVFAYLVQRGFTRDLGARPMRDAIEREIGNALARWRLESEGGEAAADTIRISLDGQQLRAAPATASAVAV
jgi:ATP-dependent Clp protease ATP-binding subunit ClpB